MSILDGGEHSPDEPPGAFSSPGPATSGAVPRLHSQISDIVSRRIRSGALARGTMLLESRVAAEFGSSRAPARRALSRLEDEGLLARAGGRGYRVVGGLDDGPAPGSEAEPVRLTQAASWERIYAEVETNIVSRTASAGWRVTEAEIAKFHDVSRTVARDVVARLQQRGVVKRDERARWYAPGLTPDYVAELYEMRWILEPIALEKAAGRIPPGRVRAARRRIEAAIARAHELDGTELDSLETDLHVELLGFSGSRSLTEAIGLYQSLLVAHSFLYRWGPRLFPTEPFLPEHLEILAALEAGRAADAIAALERHLRVSLDRALARLEIMRRGPLPEPLPYLVQLKQER